MFMPRIAAVCRALILFWIRAKVEGFYFPDPKKCEAHLLGVIANTGVLAKYESKELLGFVLYMQDLEKSLRHSGRSIAHFLANDIGKRIELHDRLSIDWVAHCVTSGKMEVKAGFHLRQVARQYANLLGVTEEEMNDVFFAITVAVGRSIFQPNEEVVVSQRIAA